jgi:hypothetical protein
MRPLRDQIVAGVAADRELAAAIARRKEASFGAPPPEDGKPAPTYADLERLAHGIEHDLERLRALADADAASTAAKEEHALADETGRIGELQAQIASFQAELDALEGPIIEMLDPHGMPVPAPPQG